MRSVLHKAGAAVAGIVVAASTFVVSVAASAPEAHAAQSPPRGCYITVRSVKANNGLGTVREMSMHCGGKKLSKDSNYYRLKMRCWLWGIPYSDAVANVARWGYSGSSSARCGYFMEPEYRGIRTYENKP